MEFIVSGKKKDEVKKEIIIFIVSKFTVKMAQDDDGAFRNQYFITFYVKQVNRVLFCRHEHFPVAL